MSENQPNRDTVTVVLWHGQYRADAEERLWSAVRNERLFFGLRNPRVDGRPGDWRLVADAYVALDRAFA